MDVALDLLDHGGPAAVTLRGVGRAADVSHNAPYRHFANKDALLSAIAARELRRQADNLDRADRSVEQVQDRLKGYVRWALRHPERFRLTFGRWDAYDPDLLGAASEARQALNGAIRAAQQKGELPHGDAERLGHLLLALAHGAADLALAGHLSGTSERPLQADELVDDLIGYLRARSHE